MSAFITWFDSLPPAQRRALAHIYRVCTTETAEDMVLDPEHSLQRFKNGFVKPDFPLRVAARMVKLCSVFDLILLNRKELVSISEKMFSGVEKGTVVPLSSRQWDTVHETWKMLRSRELSEQYLHVWAAEMIKRG